MSLSRRRTPTGSARSSWRFELDQRIAWLGNSIVPQLRDPRSFTPSITSAARLSWISDFVIPQLGTGFEAGLEAGFESDLEEVDEEGTSRDEQFSLPQTILDSTWEKPDESILSFPAPSLGRLSTLAVGSPSRPRPAASLRSSAPWTAQDPGPAPDRELPPTPAFLSGPRLWLVAAGLVFAMFCGGVDRSIVTVATPAITSEFGSLNDIGWYASAYLLPMCAFQLPFGKLYSELNHKWVFLSALAVFEAGSVVCATAQSSVVLIVGRAVAGLGGAGVVSGCIIMIGSLTHPIVRPAWIGGMATTANIAQAFGPLIGGALVTNVSWRWCFWINLPLGGATAILLLIFLHPPPKPAIPGQSRLERVFQSLDAVGTAILVPAIVCLLLALEWGGSEYAWRNWRPIVLLVFFVLLFIAWLAVQYCRGNRATLPLYLLRSPTVTFGGIYSMASYGSLALVMYYVPIWMQAVRGVSAYQAGIAMLALVLPWTVSLVLSSQLTLRTGYYAPQMLMATVLMSTMAGLLTLWRLDTATALWVCTLVFFGVGVGLGMQQPFIAAQATLTGPDTALGTSVIMFLQLLSGAIMVSVGQNVFLQALPKQLAATAPGIDASAVSALGAQDLPARLARLYNADQVGSILTAYAAALRIIFVVAVATACVSVVPACVSVLGSICRGRRSDQPPWTPSPPPPPLSPSRLSPSRPSPSAAPSPGPSATLQDCADHQSMMTFSTLASPGPSTTLQNRADHQSIKTFSSLASTASPPMTSIRTRSTRDPSWKDMGPLSETESEGPVTAVNSLPHTPRPGDSRTRCFVCSRCMGIPEERESKIMEEGSRE